MMKNDLTCGVVRDLLPSYVENLLGEESREAVDRHMAGCPECTARKEAMVSPPEAEEPEKEVDFLKQVKRANRKRIVVSVIATAACLLAALGLKAFVIGTPLQPQSVAVVAAEARDGGRTLYLSLSSTGSGNAFHSWTVETVEGVTSICARDVLVSPLYSSGQKELEIPLKDSREVWLGGISGRLVWQDGMVITQECLDLLELQTPYCGDAPAMGAIAEELRLGEIVGPYTMELQTRYEPYSWRLYFDSGADDSQYDYLIRCGYLILALVDNLDTVRYYPQPTEISGVDYAEDGTAVPWTQTRTGCEMSRGNADRGMARLTEVYNKTHGTFWKAKTNVKDYTLSPADFQRLMAVVNYCFLEGGLHEA